MLKKYALKKGSENIVTFLLALLHWLLMENNKLCKENEALKSEAEGLQEEVKKQTVMFRAEVDEMQRTHQHLQYAVDQTTHQMLLMQTNILQLIQSCNTLQEEKRALQLQLTMEQQQQQQQLE